MTEPLSEPTHVLSIGFYDATGEPVVAELAEGTYAQCETAFGVVENQLVQTSKLKFFPCSTIDGDMLIVPAKRIFIVTVMARDNHDAFVPPRPPRTERIPLDEPAFDAWAKANAGPGVIDTVDEEPDAELRFGSNQGFHFGLKPGEQQDQ